MYIKSLEVKVYDNSDDVTQISRGEAVLILDSDTFYYYGEDNNLKVMRTKESLKDEIINEYLENNMSKSVDSKIVEVPINDNKDFITIEEVKRILEDYATIKDLNEVKKDISKVKRRKIVVTEVYDEDDSEEIVDNLVEESTTEVEIDGETIDEDIDGDIEDISDLLN